MVCAIAEGDVDDSVSTDLSDACNATRFKELAQSCYEGRRGGGCCAGVMCDMSAEARVDNELTAVVRFGKFEEKDALNTPSLV